MSNLSGLRNTSSSRLAARGRQHSTGWHGVHSWGAAHGRAQGPGQRLWRPTRLGEECDRKTLCGHLHAGHWEGCTHRRQTCNPSPLMLSAMMPSSLRMVCPPSCTGTERRKRWIRRLRGAQVGNQGTGGSRGAQSHIEKLPRDGCCPPDLKQASNAAPPAHPPAPRGAAPAPRPSGSGRSAGRGRVGFDGLACHWMLGTIWCTEREGGNRLE